MSGNNPLGASACALLTAIRTTSATFWTIRPPRGRENTPVTWVTWYAAAAFCEWAGFLLPTEAQWEYAAKGGENLRYATTNGALLPRLANYGGKVGAPTPVRRYPPNPFELYDLAGNVWEWCADRYEPDFYRQPAATAKNPICGPRLRFREGDWKKALGPFVIRGGSWQSLSMDLRTSARAHQDGTLPSAFCGFRCVLPPD
ncbi:MAG: hypothetical protein KatS3mg115_1030 [Candidatus Poribacteria bacterium]|nr:MAG: hypothetical protein KatS3mg115_1030 [Candidatus Poribacteria bacterium]